MHTVREGLKRKERAKLDGGGDEGLCAKKWMIPKSQDFLSASRKADILNLI